MYKSREIIKCESRILFEENEIIFEKMISLPQTLYYSCGHYSTKN